MRKKVKFYYVRTFCPTKGTDYYSFIVAELEQCYNVLSCSCISIQGNAN